MSRYSFRPTLIPTLATLALLPLLLSLGLWQLDRAAQKEAAMAARESGLAEALLDLNNAPPAAEQAIHRRALAHGRYDTAHQFLVDNQIVQGRVGYQVLTPLRLDEGRAVLVSRGWLPAPSRRDQLPELAVAETPRRVEGTLAAGPSVGLRVGEASVEQGWPRRVQYMDYEYFNASLPYRVLPYVLQLDPSAEDGYRREWGATEFGPERHRGYAVQWFSLAAALVLIYLLVNLRRRGDADHE
ncbi:SURF1 family protein [Alkalilimnicola sp. S0819]|uniref:SURF1 family protein n=1 Tax=Alkalilimnicola sp. S0819 TaxID=2613922 RepID=UPI0012614204|nr:SURF1 family protein [Alkalilimnicola sp. S0819]KAB7624438.1 SURF1 family protein [Alkalilimnicola sp. S0819]MPQ16271.1 SURF1 family protein [Alkalilimnicola sp. S0819]